ncbi:MAG TPA: hydroxyisourate hydrolase [Acidimicrobiia bacterium]|nr:hydroxyisourate hydrolase [Acidimicrobiia bacterium]
MISISTHVLDTATGDPARKLKVSLQKRSDAGWSDLSSGVTDDDGRIEDLGSNLDPGSYRLRFDTGGYGNTFFPEIVVAVELGEARHYHIPLLLSPFGYSTYRGS